MRLLSILIVDDEPLAEKRLRNLLRDIPDTEVVGTAREGRSALELVRAREPDVVLLDIKMPGVNGLEFLEQLGPGGPVVIFVTAFAEYAADAFDLAATDYLLKPIEPDRLARALQRARTALETRQTSERIEELQSVIAQLRGAKRESLRSRFEREIWTHHRGDRLSIPVDQIEWVSAERDYLRLHVGQASYLLRQSLGAFERRLDPAAFLRLHRSAIVRVEAIRRIRRKGARVSVVLASGAEAPVSRRHRAKLLGVVERNGRG